MDSNAKVIILHPEEHAKVQALREAAINRRCMEEAAAYRPAMPLSIQEQQAYLRRKNRAIFFRQVRREAPGVIALIAGAIIGFYYLLKAILWLYQGIAFGYWHWEWFGFMNVEW